MDALLVLTNIALILLLGVLCSLIAKKIRISNALILVLLGILLSRVVRNGTQMFAFDSSLLVGIGILALVMIVFDVASKFRFKDLQTLSFPAFKIVGYFTLFSIFLLTLFTSMFFFKSIDMVNILFGVMFSIIVVGTDPTYIFLLMDQYAGAKARKLLELLELESIINTPFMVVLPFLILEIITNIELGQGDFFAAFIKQIPAFFSQVFVGIGAGLLLGIIVFKAMQKRYSHQFSPIILLTTALLAYIIAENLHGSGVLAVASLGMVFGNLCLKAKPQLKEFTNMISNMMEIIVFVFIGLMIQIPFTFEFFFYSFILFLLLILSRLAAVFIALKKFDHSFKEKLFISLSMPKGIAVAVVALAFSLYNFPQMKIILNLVLVFIIYSLILSFIIERFSRRLLSEENKGAAKIENFRKKKNTTNMKASSKLKTNAPKKKRP